MALINCPRCGNRISDKAIKCPKCGFEVSQIPFPENRFLREKRGRQVVYPDVNNATKQGNNRGWMIVFPIIVVIGIVVCVILYFNKDNKHKEAKIIAEREMLAKQAIQDSLTAVQIETERLEKLRMDSIKAIEERIEKATIHWNDLIRYDSANGYEVLNYKVIRNNLKSKDFVQTDHNREYITDSSWADFWLEEWTYVFFKDKDKKKDKLYEVTFYDTDCSVRITIYDSKLLSLLRKELKGKKLAVMPDGGVDEWKIVYYDGNTIDINFCGD